MTAAEWLIWRIVSRLSSHERSLIRKFLRLMENYFPARRLRTSSIAMTQMANPPSVRITPTVPELS